MAEITNLKAVLTIMLFWSFAMTILTYTMPSSMLNYIQPFESDLPSATDTATTVQGSIDSQINIPIIELGALIFYSGNIVIDLILNFITAIPEMMSILLNGILLLINVPTNIATTVKLFAFSMFTIFYILGVIALLLNVRSGKGLI
jgi:hypothetical protein